MNLQLFLFKDNNCDLCKVMQQEITNNPPKCDSTIICAKHAFGQAIVGMYRVKRFPTAILVDDDANMEIYRWEGRVDSKTINKEIDNYVANNKM